MWMQSNRWLMWNGRKDAAVFLTMQADGRFLWTFRKWASYSNTIDAAKEWIETLAETEEIPAGKHWVQFSSVFG
jgi:hypothetical protein